jgi:hypothetical protein
MMLSCVLIIDATAHILILVTFTLVVYNADLGMYIVYIVATHWFPSCALANCTHHARTVDVNQHAFTLIDVLELSMC